MNKTFEELLADVISAHQVSIFSSTAPTGILERQASAVAAIIKFHTREVEGGLPHMTLNNDGITFSSGNSNTWTSVG